MYELFEKMFNAYKKYENGGNREYAAFITSAIVFCKNVKDNPYPVDYVETENSAEDATTEEGK